MRNLFIKLSVVSVISLSVSVINTVSAADDVPMFEITDGKVDKGTFNGWRRFHSTCHVCHGQDAMGSSFAPNLTESLKSMDYPTFVKTVTEGRQSTGAAGGASAMPAFGEDPNVAKHVDDIFRFLTARANGGLAPGRPKK